MKAARQKCTKIQADMVFKLPDLIMPALVEECQDYTIESAFIIASCCCCIIYCIRRRIDKQRYRANGLPPTTTTTTTTDHHRAYTMALQKSTSYQNGLLSTNKTNGINSHNHHNNNKHKNHNGHYHYEKQNNHKHHNENNSAHVEMINTNHKQPMKETLDNVDSEELKLLNPPPNTTTIHVNNHNNDVKHIDTSEDCDVIAKLV
ncbi:hypothetical protein BLA29_003158 [Euroglyphus maynei]|uniref:Uncharacterized protein n=1 Tax=Euroglyphus maynei TaxID=6958 RepID=A0A1Y3B6G2_EURMA|nr:hypothetical protein BLA29_003158 [Euroglyphus maynei]